MIRFSLKSLFILSLTVCLAGSVWSQEDMFGGNVHGPQHGLEGKSFAITYSIDEEAYTDIITFEPDSSFSMAFFSQSEDSDGFFFDCLGILFYAHFSGAIVFEPFSFSFYGLHFNPAIHGISIIELGGSRYKSIFSGTETNATEEKI